MFDKNRNKTVGLCLMVVTACLVLAALWGVLGVPGPALGAGKSGGKKGSGQGALHGCITLRDDDGDRVLSDDFGPYCDGFDNTKGGLLEFFRFTMKVKKNGAGRRLFLNFADFTAPDGGTFDETLLPAEVNIWILGVNGTLADWRAQDLDTEVLREGNLFFGKTGNEEASVSYGRWGGDNLTVTRIDDDVWTIESFTSNTAVVGTNNLSSVFGSGPMPFKVTYNGQ